MLCVASISAGRCSWQQQQTVSALSSPSRSNMLSVTAVSTSAALHFTRLKRHGSRFGHYILDCNHIASSASRLPFLLLVNELDVTQVALSPSHAGHLLHALAATKNGETPVSASGEEGGLLCPGCGVIMQDENSDLPGYYQKSNTRGLRAAMEMQYADSTIVDETPGGLDSWHIAEDKDVEMEDEIDWDEWSSRVMDEEKELHRKRIETGFRSRRGTGKAAALKTRDGGEEDSVEETSEVIICARCFSLRKYGQVKNPEAENLIPDFDFHRLLVTELVGIKGNPTITLIVIVVDCVDFDGSFPRTAAASMFKALQKTRHKLTPNKSLPRAILVATKVDLLPDQVTESFLDGWVRRRAKAAGVSKLFAVFKVSSKKDMGVRDLLSFMREKAGHKGDVWIIGAQNAGKSTLINALAKNAGAKISKLTEAAVPGTTLGILRVLGILRGNSRMYDTPGLLHPYLLSQRLNRDEQKIAMIQKELKPRTYRIKARYTILVGGLSRLDIDEASAETIYVTVWASLNVSLHVGKTENADEVFRDNVGARLQPPIGTDRASEMGKWVKKRVEFSGKDWNVNSRDITVGGFCWFSVCLSGQAAATVWVHTGIQVTEREPLIIRRPSVIQPSGFWIPRDISQAIGKRKSSSMKHQKEEESEEDEVEEELY